jgi:hypothetical protein
MSSPQQSELRVCLSTPKLGTLAFFLIFMILIPITLISSNNTEYIQYYLPFTVLLASTLTSAGAPDNFQDLYPLFPTSIMGFLSANLINFFALAGILWYIITVALQYNDKELAVVVGLIIISITYPVATQAIPFFIRHGDMFLRRVAPRVRWVGNWHKYFIGFMMIVFLLILQILIIGVLTSNGGLNFGLSSGNNNVSRL